MCLDQSVRRTAKSRRNLVNIVQTSTRIDDKLSGRSTNDSFSLFFERCGRASYSSSTNNTTTASDSVATVTHANGVAIFSTGFYRCHTWYPEEQNSRNTPVLKEHACLSFIASDRFCPFTRILNNRGSRSASQVENRARTVRAGNYGLWSCVALVGVRRASDRGERGRGGGSDLSVLHAALECTSMSMVFHRHD